jgi:LysM repeat protein
VYSAPKHRRPQSFRRTGRHAAPTQLEKAAEKAGKAAPAAAMAGLLVTGTAHVAGTAHVPAAAVAVVGQPVTVAGQIRTDAMVTRDQQASRSYIVQPGDTLWAISERIYGTPADAQWIFQVNRSVIQNPNLIYPGQRLTLPGDPPAGATVSVPEVAHDDVTAASTTLSGTLSCAGLEELWEEAGGSSGEAVMAASIAMAESSGEQFATGPVGERGYWQINPNHGALSTYDPLGNAKAAVIISDDGTDWTPWTTFTSGAYLGRC